MVTHTDYIQNDAITTTLTSASERYLIDFVADSYVHDSANTIHTDCRFDAYDNQGVLRGQQANLTLGHLTLADVNITPGTTANSFACSNHIRTTYGYDAWGNVVVTTDAYANVGGGPYQLHPRCVAVHHAQR